MGSKTVEVSVSGRPGVVDLGDVVLEPGLALRGRVHTKAGMPVADALVERLAPAADVQRLPHGRGTRPTPTARFVLAGLAAGSYELTAAAPGFTKGRTKAVAGGEDADLTVDAAGSLTGLVVEDGDRPVEGFHIHAELQSGVAARVGERSSEGRGHPRRPLRARGPRRGRLLPARPRTRPGARQRVERPSRCPGRPPTSA